MAMVYCLSHHRLLVFRRGLVVSTMTGSFAEGHSIKKMNTLALFTGLPTIEGTSLLVGTKGHGSSRSLALPISHIIRRLKDGISFWLNRMASSPFESPCINWHVNTPQS